MALTQEYSPQITSADCLDSLKNEGALLLRGFVPENEQQEIVAQVLSHKLTEVDRSGHTIPEQFQDIGWEFRHAPNAVFNLGRRICDLVRPELPSWFINHVRGQLYSPGEVGIGRHRDYSWDLRVIAVASFISSAHFEIEADSGIQSWEVNPGDLVLMRGTLLNGTIDDRPPHSIFTQDRTTFICCVSAGSA
jgi:hypothetical protein